MFEDEPFIYKYIYIYMYTCLTGRDLARPGPPTPPPY